ncbi:MAG: hypothetical protein PW788_02640 [Micavibrio sp.]|nr:hypothetical protein [Micavibrio sp.]
MASDSSLTQLLRALTDMQARTTALNNVATQDFARILKDELGSTLGAFLGKGNAAATAAGNINVIIQNNSDATVTARETSDGFDQRTLEITIDQMVANSLVRGRETSSVLRSLFGIVPSLIGR